jgi:hypothetical protein
LRISAHDNANDIAIVQKIAFEGEKIKFESILQILLDWSEEFGHEMVPSQNPKNGLQTVKVHSSGDVFWE